MYLVVLVPESVKVEFSTLVDDMLTRVLDWNLILFENILLEGEGFSSSFYPTVCIGLECPLPGVFHPGLQELFFNHPECVNQLMQSSFWLFSLSPICLTGDVDEIVDQLLKLGCHIRLTHYHPCQVDC